MAASNVITIERIQLSMRELEAEAFDRGLDPMEYVRTKPLHEPSNKEEYIKSMAELGIESDIASDDILSWTYEIEDIEESLYSYPDLEQDSTLEQVNDKERELLKQLMTKTPSIKSTTNDEKENNGNSVEFQ